MASFKGNKASDDMSKPATHLTDEPVYARPFFVSVLQDGDRTNHRQRVTFELAPEQDQEVKGCCKDFKVLSKAYTSRDYDCDFIQTGSDTMTLSQADTIVRHLFKYNEIANAFYSKTRWEEEHMMDHQNGMMIDPDYHELSIPYYLHCKYNHFIYQYRYGQSEVSSSDTYMITDPEVCYG